MSDTTYTWGTEVMVSHQQHLWVCGHLYTHAARSTGIVLDIQQGEGQPARYRIALNDGTPERASTKLWAEERDLQLLSEVE